MGLKRVNVSDISELLSHVNQLEREGIKVFVLFCGSTDQVTGTSWCSDCVKAEPVIEKVASNDEIKGVLITCTVGDRPTWKDPNNPFRTDMKLTGVPTLLEWGTVKRLGPEECANEELVRMLLEED